MTRGSEPDGGNDRDVFAREVAGKSHGMVGEFWGLMKAHRKWWLTPLIAAAVLLGAFMLLFGTPLSPLIYTLF